MNESKLRERMKQVKPSGFGKWNHHAKMLRQHVEKEDIDNFLNWSTVTATMFVGNNRQTFLEHKALPEFWKPFIEDTRVGNPQMLNDYTSGNYAHQAYQFNLFEGIYQPEIKSVAEFGGGYGSMAVILSRKYALDYHIYDLPEFLLLQEYYLSQNDTKAHYHSEHDKLEADLVIALCSLSEVSNDVKDSFLSNVTGKYYLIAYQTTWGDIDNRKYFEEFAEGLSEHKIFRDPLLSNNFLVGKR